MPSRERIYASVALAVLWAALAAILGAYAVARESVGALLLAAVVAWLCQTAWASAWRVEDEDEDLPHRF